MTLTKALWPPFPKPFWPQCACSEICEIDGSRRLRCHACGQLADRVLPAKLKVGEEACAAIDGAERLIAQLAIMGFRAQLGARGNSRAERPATASRPAQESPLGVLALTIMRNLLFRLETCPLPSVAEAAATGAVRAQETNSRAATRAAA